MFSNLRLKYHIVGHWFPVVAPQSPTFLSPVLDSQPPGDLLLTLLFFRRTYPRGLRVIDPVLASRPI